MRRLGFLLIALAAFPAAAAAGDAPKKDDSSPEGVARGALAALKDDRLEDFARAMHPGELRKLKDLLLAVGEAAERGEEGKQFLALFHGAGSLADLRKLDDVPFFAAFFRGITRLQPELKQALGGSEAKVIGRVPEGEDTVHVVYRMTVSVQGAKFTKVEVISLRKTGAGWGMLLSGEFEGMASALKQRFGGSK